MKEIKRYTVAGDKIGLLEHANGEVVLFSDYERLQARIKELESQSHINEIKAQGIEEAIKKADNETYIGIVGQEFPPQSQYKSELLCYAEQLRTKHD